MDYLLFRDGVEGPDVVLHGDGCEGVIGEETMKSEWITFCSGRV